MKLAYFIAINLVSIIVLQRQCLTQATNTNTTTDDDNNNNNNNNNNPLECPTEPRTELSQDCQILKVFNRRRVDLMHPTYVQLVARDCACELTNMPWLEAYDKQPLTRRLALMVDNVLSRKQYYLPDGQILNDSLLINANLSLSDAQRYTYPPYLWSDDDIIMNGVSIYTSTRNYFQKVKTMPSMAVMSHEKMIKNYGLYVANFFCVHLAKDELKLYQYLENLERLSPITFFELIKFDQFIRATYQASKACKLLLIHRLYEFKLRPDNEQLVIVTDEQRSSSSINVSQEKSFNNIGDYMMGEELEGKDQQQDIDLALKYLSLHLMNCKPWQKSKLTIEKLQDECPMTLKNELPVDWMRKYPSQRDKSRMAIKCGCQLLLHNSTWSELMDDQDIVFMNKALVNYINEHRFPHFEQVPIWALHGWFENKLSALSKDRTTVLNEMVKSYMFNQQKQEDSTEIVTPKLRSWALEVLRRGCNLLIFNQKSSMQKVYTKKGVELEGTELKLIKYLDNLRVVSQDPMFVFHLTLQDANLFKLHALSRMCQPIIK